MLSVLKKSIISLFVPAVLIFYLIWHSGYPQFPGQADLDGFTKIAPGLTHKKYVFEEGPFVADVLEMRRNVGKNKLLAWRSGGLIPTTIQSQDASANGRTILAGINADFFSFQSTITVGNQVTDGEWVMGVSSRRSHVLVDFDGNVEFGRVSFSGNIRFSDGNSAPITGVNRHRANDQAMFYNKNYGCDRFRSDSTGVEFALKLAKGERWSAGNYHRLIVKSRNSYVDNLCDFDALLSVGVNHESYSVYANKQIYDTLSVFLGFDDNSIKNIAQVVGGGGMILRNGKDVTTENIEVERIGEAFLQNRHPRTLVARDESGETIWLITVDGRQEASVGMNFPEMASFLLDLGASDAVNLDGGGSTTMVVNHKVANRPSDPTGERAVANVLLIERLK